MKPLSFLSGTTKKIIIATLVLLAYGYLCRLIGLYFFWESKTIGWTLFWIAVIFILRNRIKQKKLQNKSTIIYKIGIGFCIFFLLLKGILFFAVPQTTAFERAVSFIKTNPDIGYEAGTIKGIFLVPIGGMGMTKSSHGTAGNADLHFIVKGSVKYIDVELLLSKDFDTDWQIGMNKE